MGGWMDGRTGGWQTLVCFQQQGKPRAGLCPGRMSYRGAPHGSNAMPRWCPAASPHLLQSSSLCPAAGDVREKARTCKRGPDVFFSIFLPQSRISCVFEWPGEKLGGLPPKKREPSEQQVEMPLQTGGMPRKSNKRVVYLKRGAKDERQQICLLWDEAISRAGCDGLGAASRVQNKGMKGAVGRASKGILGGR